MCKSNQFQFITLKHRKLYSQQPEPNLPSTLNPAKLTVEVQQHHQQQQPQQHQLPILSMKPRATSITGGLPYLLLSVIPPIIPRASWPSAEYMHGPMRKSVTFASQGHLVGQSSDIRKLQLAHQQATGKTGIIERIRGIFSRTTTVDSSASLNLGESNNNNNHTNNNSNNNSSSNHSNQKKATLKSHKGLFTRLVPSSVSVSCNALAKSGQSSGNTLVRVPSEPEILTIAKYIKPPESKVNFSLPVNRRPSDAFQPPSLRERTKCSPRFPHRVVPTCSLSALEESSDDKSLSVSPKDPPRISLNQTYTNGKWKSMDSPNYPGTNFNFETLR